jgi:hypothetical protein
MLGLTRRIGAKLSLMVLTLALTTWLAGGVTAFAHGGGGGGGGGGHGGGGFGGGGFGGGHMGGFGGGFGGFGGGFGRGFGGGFGRFGYPGFGFGGFGWGYPWYGYGYGYPGYGYGLGGYGLGGYGLGGYGLGYGYGGYGLGGYGMGGYGMGGYGMGGYGMGYPSYGYGMGYPNYGYPSYGYGVASANPASGAGFSYSPAYVAPGQAGAPTMVNGRRILGIDEEPVVLADGRKAMKITNVYSNTGAQTAGLQVGDVLISANGYLTEQRGNLAWIIANATPGSELKLVVRTRNDGKDHTIVAVI